MASNYTSNYHLCQWQASDKVLRTEFNHDNAKIDDGASQRTLSFPGRPLAVFLVGDRRTLVMIRGAVSTVATMPPAGRSASTPWTTAPSHGTPRTRFFKSTE